MALAKRQGRVEPPKIEQRNPNSAGTLRSESDPAHSKPGHFNILTWKNSIDREAWQGYSP